MSENYREELEKIGPHLSKIDKEKLRFDIPEAYFNTLEDKLLGPSKDNTFALRRPLYRVLAAAAGIALLLSVFFLIGDTETNDALAGIGNTELDLYIDSNLEDFEEDLILDQSMPDDSFLEELFSDQELLLIDEVFDEFNIQDLQSIL